MTIASAKSNSKFSITSIGPPFLEAKITEEQNRRKAAAIEQTSKKHSRLEAMLITLMFRPN